MSRILKFIRIAAAATAAGVLSVGAALAEFPEKPLTMIVGWAPGGSADISARILAELAEKELGQRIVVQNVPGGASSVGTLQVANADPDGYTLLNNWVAGHIAVRLFNPDVGYDIDTFAPIVGSVRLPFTITVAADNPANTLEEFGRWSEDIGRPLNVSICGAVSVPRMVGEEVLAKVGVTEINPVAYPGCMPDAMKDLIAGSLDAAVGVLPATTVFDGRVKHLAVIANNRDPLSPDVPTAAEQGYDIGWGRRPACCRGVLDAGAGRFPGTGRTPLGAGCADRNPRRLFRNSFSVWLRDRNANPDRCRPAPVR